MKCLLVVVIDHLKPNSLAELPLVKDTISLQEFVGRDDRREWEKELKP